MKANEFRNLNVIIYILRLFVAAEAIAGRAAAATIGEAVFTKKSHRTFGFFSVKRTRHA